MNKFLFYTILFGFTAGAWGQSIGIGSSFAPDWGGGFENKTTFMGKTIQALSDTAHLGMSFFILFDADYLTASVGLYNGESTSERKMKTNSPLIEAKEGMSYELFGMNFGLFAKYPFAPSSRLKIFPLIGCEYNTIFLAEINGEEADNPFDWNQLWFKLGGGVDYITKFKLFFRFEWLYGFRPSTEAEKKMANDVKKQFEKSFYENFNITQRFTSDTFPGRGMTLKTAIGYKF